MTATDTAPSTRPAGGSGEPGEAAVSLTPGWRGSARAARGWIAVAVLAALIAVAALVIGGTAASQGQTLGADNPAPRGAEAVVNVLRDHGVTVQTISSMADPQPPAGTTPPGSTVLVYDPNGYLDEDGLKKAASLGHRLVLVSPTKAVRAALPQAQTVDEKTLENQHVAEGGNAAAAIRLLGRDPALYWYLPSPAASSPGGAVSIADAAPGWVTPVVLLGALVVLAAAIWRGRRFGRLVYEDLPVVVPAGETLEGRARLYARAQARLHALDQLRLGALGRLAGLLGLPRSARVDEIAVAAARATGLADSEVLGVLRDGVPATDAELVASATALAQLERDVRRAVAESTHQPDRMKP